MGDDFSNTIKWCLTHQQADSDDDHWRNDLFHNVIVPLYNIYEGLPGSRKGLVTADIIHSGDFSDGAVGIIGSQQFNSGTFFFGMITNLHLKMTHYKY